MSNYTSAGVEAHQPQHDTIPYCYTAETKARIVARMQEQYRARSESHKLHATKACDKPGRTELVAELATLDESDPFLSCRQGVHVNFTKSEYPPAAIPALQLQLIFIDDLLLEGRHLDCVLIVRTVCEQKCLVATRNAVEDAKGNVDRLAVYEHCTSRTEFGILPKHSVIAIKQPYYHAAAYGAILRVDHPSDIVHLSANHDMMPSSSHVPVNTAPSPNQSTYKVEGNAAHKAGKFLHAVHKYTLGIKQAGKNILLASDLYRNRSMVNFLLKRFGFAISDAKAALLSDDHGTVEVPVRTHRNSKSWFRAGRAAYDRKDFKFCQNIFWERLEAVS